MEKPEPNLLAEARQVSPRSPLLPGRNGPKRTAGYIVYIKELWLSGPSCLSLWGMSGPTTYGFASAIQEIWNHQFQGHVIDSLLLEESELIFVEITADRNQLVPAVTRGRPDYWRNWTMTWNRHGRLIDWLGDIPRFQ